MSVCKQKMFSVDQNAECEICTGVPVKEIAKHVTTLTFCLSKVSPSLMPPWLSPRFADGGDVIRLADLALMVGLCCRALERPSAPSSAARLTSSPRRTA